MMIALEVLTGGLRGQRFLLRDASEEALKVGLLLEIERLALDVLETIAHDSSPVAPQLVGLTGPQLRGN